MRYFKKNENNYWENFELLINSNTPSHPNNFMDMFRKLQFYVGCGCVCVYVWIKERKKQIFKDRERESMCKYI